MAKPRPAPGSPKVRTLQGKDSKKPLSNKERAIHDVALEVKTKVTASELTHSVALSQAKAQCSLGLQSLTAAIAMPNLTPIQLRDTYDYSAGVEDAISEAKGFARARVLDLALRIGESTGATGLSKKLTFEDGRQLLAKCQKSGTDPKKFEAALRARQIEVTKYMVPDIKYKLPGDYDAPAKAVLDGVFTADEIKTMEYEPSYAVERSKEGSKE